MIQKADGHEMAQKEQRDTKANPRERANTVASCSSSTCQTYWRSCAGCGQVNQLKRVCKTMSRQVTRQICRGKCRAVCKTCQDTEDA